METLSPQNSEENAAAAPPLCPVCGNLQSRFRFVYKEKSFAECGACGLVYCCSPPALQEKQAFYQKNYYDALAPFMPGLTAARASIYRGVLEEVLAWRKTGRILDVGCGHGDFLKLAEAAGWEGWGIEPSEEAADTAKKNSGLKIFCGATEDAEFPENHFDVITLWNVIDCLLDPRAVLQKIRKWLRPGGLFLIRTPNASFHLSIFRLQEALKPLLEKFRGEKNDAFIFRRTNFCAPALRRLLVESGFEGIEIQNGPMTEGDPYQMISAAGVMQVLKKTLFKMAQAVEWLTGNRAFIGPVLICKATKEMGASGGVKSGSAQMRLKIKQAALHLLAVVGYLLGLPLWRRLFGGECEIRILTYHSVHPWGNELSVRPSEFERQLQFLAKYYGILSLEQAVELLERGRLPERPSVVLTFDDGFADNYHFAFPALERQKIPATIFQLTGLRKAAYLSDAPELLSDEAVREMSARGIDFGSHGETHRRLALLSEEEALSEMIKSRKKIESLTGKPPHFFAYPYGRFQDFDSTTEELARRAGYKMAFSAIYGTNGPEGNRYRLKRIGIESADTCFTLKAKLNGALDFLALLDLPRVQQAFRMLDSMIFSRPQLQDPVLLVSVDFPPDQNGVSTISGHLSRELAREKGKNFLVMAPKAPGDKAWDTAESYQAFRYPGNESGYWRFFPILFFMPWVILKYRARKILVMNIGYGGVIAWLLSFLYPLEYILFAYGYEFEKFKENPFLRKFYLKIYSRARGVITCSDQIRKRLVDFGVPAEKIDVAYPAADPLRFSPAADLAGFRKEKNLEGRRVILSAGRLVERKGHDQVLRALEKIADQFPDILYVIAGAGPAEERLRGMTRELQLQPYVRFLGRVSEEDLNGYYNACEFFVMPSREIAAEGHIEGFGIVFLEANACAKPCIGGRSGGVTEAIAEGKTGFLVDPESVEELSEKMLFFLSKPEEARKMGAEGLKRLHQEFSWARYAEKVKRYL